jgi:hypothetical protein
MHTGIFSFPSGGIAMVLKRWSLIISVMIIFALSPWSSSRAMPGKAPGSDPVIEQAQLIASDGAAWDAFGARVALSADGDTALLGAQGVTIDGKVDQGAAYVYVRSGTVWSQQAKLVASDGAEYDSFGNSVALSADGNIAVIGARGTKVGNNNGQGAVYIFVRSGLDWTQMRKLFDEMGSEGDTFGRSVAISPDGNTLMVGSPGVNQNQGAVYVFTRTGLDWSYQSTLSASDGVAGDDFGYSIALSQNDTDILIGADFARVGENDQQGKAYVFTREGEDWIEKATLVANDGAVYDNFGYRTAISGDGNFALIGATYAAVGENTNQGKAYVFTRSGDSWSQQAILTPSDGATDDQFGSSVALNHDGTQAWVGSWCGGHEYKCQGTVYILERSGSLWFQVAKLIPVDSTSIDAFGEAISLGSNENTVLIGAGNAMVDGREFQGKAYVFVKPEPVLDKYIFLPSIMK